MTYQICCLFVLLVLEFSALDSQSATEKLIDENDSIILECLGFAGRYEPETFNFRLYAHEDLI